MNNENLPATKQRKTGTNQRNNSLNTRAQMGGDQKGGVGMGERAGMRRAPTPPRPEERQVVQGSAESPYCTKLILHCMFTDWN